MRARRNIQGPPEDLRYLDSFLIRLIPESASHPGAIAFFRRICAPHTPRASIPSVPHGGPSTASTNLQGRPPARAEGWKNRPHAIFRTLDPAHSGAHPLPPVHRWSVAATISEAFLDTWLLAIDQAIWTSPGDMQYNRPPTSRNTKMHDRTVCLIICWTCQFYFFLNGAIREAPVFPGPYFSGFQYFLRWCGLQSG
jgi:hypothetical protein